MGCKCKHDLDPRVTVVEHEIHELKRRRSEERRFIHLVIAALVGATAQYFLTILLA